MFFLVFESGNFVSEGVIVVFYEIFSLNVMFLVKKY